jgi:hypothetical protein
MAATAKTALVIGKVTFLQSRRPLAVATILRQRDISPPRRRWSVALRRDERRRQAAPY